MPVLECLCCCCALSATFRIARTAALHLTHCTFPCQPCCLEPFLDLLRQLPPPCSLLLLWLHEHTLLYALLTVLCLQPRSPPPCSISAQAAPGAVPITVAHGDGIGPEIMSASLKVLEAAGANIAVEPIAVGEQVRP